MRWDSERPLWQKDLHFHKLFALFPKKCAYCNDMIWLEIIYEWQKLVANMDMYSGSELNTVDRICQRCVEIELDSYPVTTKKAYRVLKKHN